MLRALGGIALVLPVFLLATQSLATVFPDNEMNRNDDINRRTEVDEKTFNKTLDLVSKTFAPVVANFGAKLEIRGDWGRSTVNGEADREGKTWVVNMYGGLARLPGITPENFLFMTCHELGHHIAGFPFYPDAGWPSAESEADYFATRVCLKKIWKDDVEGNAAEAKTATPFAIKKCNEVWSTENDRNLCARVAMAGDRYAKFYADIRGWYPPELDTPEPFRVYATFFMHAKAQTKLDIYLAGDLCNAPWNDKIIPGLNAKDDLAAEKEAAKYSCHQASGFADGIRPLSYFRPSYNYKPVTLKALTLYAEPGSQSQPTVGFGNEEAAITTGVSARLISNTPGVAVIQGESAVGDIKQGATKYATQPFQIKVAPNFECGAPYELKVVTNSPAVGTFSFKKSFLAGSFASVLKQHLDDLKNIPNYGEIYSTIHSTVEGPIRRAKVKAHLRHQYGRDLKIFLVAPNGTRKFLTSPDAPEDDMIDISEDVDMPTDNAKGDWQLNIIDDFDEYTSGTLYWWELELSRAVCGQHD